MKYFVFFLFLYFAAPSFSETTAQKSIRDRVVHIETFASKGGNYGTGVWFDQDHVITATHVVAKQKTIHLKMPDRTVAATVINTSQDVALLKSSSPSQFTTLPIADVSIGDDIFFWSTYDAVKDKTNKIIPVLNKSFVAAKNYRKEKEDGFILGTYLLPGASGSGAFNENGELVGIVSATVQNGDCEWYTVVTDTSLVRSVLSKR